MCEVKVNEVGAVIKKLKQLDKDGMGGKSVAELARVLAEVNGIVNEFSDYEKDLKKELMLRDIGVTVYEFPDIGKKVLQGSRAFTKFDTAEIGKVFLNENRLNDFFKIVDISKTWLDEHIKDSDPLRAAIFTRSVSGKNSFVTVAKLK